MCESVVGSFRTGLRSGQDRTTSPACDPARTDRPSGAKARAVTGGSEASPSGAGRRASRQNSREDPSEGISR